MNDLAEKALHGLDVARRELWARPMLTVGALGFVLGTIVVVAGGRVGAARTARPLTSWLGLQDTHGADASDVLPGSIMLAAVGALVLLWLVVVELVRRRPQPVRHVWAVAAAWGAPFVLGPPLTDTSINSYVAFGLLQRHGRSPYDAAPAALGDAPVVTAVDPGSRGTPSGVGPLGTLTQHLAVSIGSGNAVAALILLRVLGVVTAVAIGRLAADLARRHRSRALSLTVLNPLVLLYVVSAGHLDGLMTAFVLAALRAAGRRHWRTAVALACVAGSVSAQGFVVVPAIVVVHWLGRRTTAGWRLPARDLTVAALTTAAAGLVVRDGFGWLSTVSKQFPAHPPYSAAGALALLLRPVVPGASYDDLAAGARITVLTAMLSVVVYLAATAGRRPLDRTVGYSLLALALLAPVLFPWYLLWGTLCLAATATGARRIVVLALCAAGCLMSPNGFAPLTTDVLTGVALLVVLAVTAAVLRRGRDLPAPPPGRPVSAGG